jgi:hypothetical protein
MKTFKWTVEIEVSEVWVGDGFQLDEDHLKDAILANLLGYATEDEVRVKIVKAPSLKAIAEAQGYEAA